ncbi:MAG: glycosyltransferase family 4 protein [Candidatus Bathyarchaeia archaeon]
MRVLFLIHNFPPQSIGGHQIRCQRTAEGLRKRGHEVLVLTTYRWGDSPSKEGYVWRLLRSRWSEPPKRSIFNWVSVYRHNIKIYQRVLSEFQPDVVCQWNLTWCTVAFVKYVYQNTPCPVVKIGGGMIPGRNLSLLEDGWTHFCQTIPSNPFRRWVKKLVVKIASFWMPTEPQKIVYDTATFLSKFDLQQCLRYGMEVKNPVVLYQGVDTSSFLPRTPRDYQNPPRFLFANRLDPDKDALTFLAAVEKLLQRGYPVKGSIAGGDSLDAEYRQEVLKRIGSLNGVIQFMDRVPPNEMPRVFQNHDVFVIGFGVGWIGMSTLEAMTCGLAPIISAFEDVDGLLTEGEICLFYPFGDADALAEQMERLIREPQLVIKLGQNAQRLANERFTMDRYLDDTEALLESVVCKA